MFIERSLKLSRSPLSPPPQAVELIKVAPAAVIYQFEGSYSFEEPRKFFVACVVVVIMICLLEAPGEYPQLVPPAAVVTT